MSDTLGNLSTELDSFLLEQVRGMKDGSIKRNASILRVAKDRLKDLHVGPPPDGDSDDENMADELGLDESSAKVPPISDEAEEPNQAQV